MHRCALARGDQSFHRYWNAREPRQLRRFAADQRVGEERSHAEQEHDVNLSESRIIVYLVYIMALHYYGM